MTMTYKIIYWIATLWLASGVLSTGALQLFKAKAEGTLLPPGVYGITRLGYPVYFLTILGVWKVLGVVALLIPKFPLLKEWAYAGLFFVMLYMCVRDFVYGEEFSAVSTKDSTELRHWSPYPLVTSG